MLGRGREAIAPSAELGCPDGCQDKSSIGEPATDAHRVDDSYTAVEWARSPPATALSLGRDPLPAVLSRRGSLRLHHPPSARHRVRGTGPRLGLLKLNGRLPSRPRVHRLDNVPVSATSRSCRTCFVPWRRCRPHSRGPEGHLEITIPEDVTPIAPYELVEKGCGHRSSFLALCSPVTAPPGSRCRGATTSASDRSTSTSARSRTRGELRGRARLCGRAL